MRIVTQLQSGLTDWLLFIYVMSLVKNTRMKTIMIIYSQKVMGMEGAEDIGDYAAI